jgi:hypothetical protein
MNDFQRTGNSKEALEVGNITIYKEKWKKEMTSILFDDIPNWAKELAIEYTYAQMDFQKGCYDFYLIDMDQTSERVFTISLEGLIDQLNEFGLARSLEHIF